MAALIRAGDVVEVRSREEILASLDENGCIDSLPFMPEMLEACGTQFTVASRADKTCDTIEHGGLRQVPGAVHLEGMRCSGAAHGGCQAGCLLFWKEEWLRKKTDASPRPVADVSPGRVRCTEAVLQAGTTKQNENGNGNSGEVHYRCQATELLKASTPLKTWDVRQYVRDVRSGNTGLIDLLKSMGWSVFRYTMQNVRGYRAWIGLYNAVQRLRGGAPFVPLAGSHSRTPHEPLDLAAGELVQVKRVDEIKDTLDASQRNRGLYFDQEMTPYCGGTYRVNRRVTRIIEESTGRMLKLPGGCVILDNVVCTGRYHMRCPRAIYPFWRETWLRRAEAPGP